MSAKNYGELHPRAKLTDSEVELIRSLYEEEVLGVRVWGYTRLAAKFDVDRGTIRDIVKFRRRRGPPINDNQPPPSNDNGSDFSVAEDFDN